MTTTTGGAALVQALVAQGTDTVFGIPGTHNLAIYAALDRLGVRHVLPRHEQGAAYAADGYARVTGRPGVVVTTTGPAILNAVAAAAQAYSDSVPMFLVSPGVPSDHPGYGNGLLHEIKNQSGALDAVIKRSIRVTTVAEIPVAVAQLWSDMLDGRPRPVHLEIPLDLLDVEAEVPAAPVASHALSVASDESLTRAADALNSARKPLVVVGGGAAHAAAEVVALAEKLGAPVVTTINGKGTISDGHPLLVGAGVQHRATLELAAGADVVLALGTELAPSDWWYGAPKIARLVRIDVDPVGLYANVIPDVAVLGDLADAAPRLTARLDARNDEELDLDAIRSALAQEARTSGAAYVSLTDALGKVLPRETIVAGDNSMSVYYGALSNLPVHRPNGFLFPTGVGTLGYGLPAGIGAKIGLPEAPVVVLQGDGGIMFTIAELAMAAQERLALPIVVVDNGGYGEIRNEMSDREEPVHAVDLGHPDFAMLARSVGCHGVTARSATEVADAVVRALSADAPTVIHVREEHL